MQDLEFNFETNDIEFQNGTSMITESCSRQNGALIFNKSAASITEPQFGVGFEDFFPNLPSYVFGRVETIGEEQMHNDGALYSHISILANEYGKASSVEIEVKYRE